eukprot:gb/GFBE01081305.1/.p1 GENE.gb/GFBE01081305.1/~~gb/GFBE01081305.1/.p1  ORF type:complete len:241 (+),score=40.99 gb/GFBE01081305.1/:1-723(+)
MAAKPPSCLGALEVYGLGRRIRLELSECRSTDKRLLSQLVRFVRDLDMEAGKKSEALLVLHAMKAASDLGDTTSVKQSENRACMPQTCPVLPQIAICTRFELSAVDTDSPSSRPPTLSDTESEDEEDGEDHEDDEDEEEADVEEKLGVVTEDLEQIVRRGESPCAEIGADDSSPGCSFRHSGQGSWSPASVLTESALPDLAAGKLQQRGPSCRSASCAQNAAARSNCWPVPEDSSWAPAA